MKNKEKIVLITGGAKRIGKELVVGMSKSAEKYKFIIHYNKSRKQAEELVISLNKIGIDSKPIHFDLNQVSKIKNFAENAEGIFGKVDILINNASIFKQEKFHHITEKSFDETININLKAPFLLSNLLSKGMVRRKYGKIINIGDSVGTYKTWKDYSHYCVSKGGLETMTKVLSLELAPFVQVNAIAPGPILKPSAKHKKNLYTKISKSKVGIKSMVNSLKFLIDSDFITGEVISVDNGEKLK